MANVVKLISGKIIDLTIDSDWTWTDDFPMTEGEGIEVAEIVFTPGAADDKLVLLDQDANGGHIFPPVLPWDVYCERQCYPEGTYIKPFIDFSECTLSAGHNILIIARSNVIK